MTAKAIQNGEEGEMPTDEQLKYQNEWLWYLEQLESGKATDPTGQYVSKEIQIAQSEKPGEERSARLKESAFDGKTDWGFNEYRQAYTMGTPSQPACTDCTTQYPTTGGFGSGNGSGTGSTHGGGTVTPTTGPTTAPMTTVFLSSEGQAPYTGSGNPNGDILDLKIVKGSLPNESPLPGYTKIPLDLNRGAGGSYIYLTFTRRPSEVQIGDESGWGWPQEDIEGSVKAVQAFTRFTGISISWLWGGAERQPYLPVWSPNLIPGSDWKQPDLNDGSGGKWVYAFQYKSPSYSNTPVEVGIIASNTQRPVPPAGWQIDYQDLNEGAGGDYIYFCYKDR